MKSFTFSFDDGYESWPRAGETLEKNDCRGTFNVCLRNVTEKRHLDRRRLFPPADVITWDEVRDLQDRGHEIACHGTRHVDLGTATAEELQMEIVHSKSVCASQGIKVTTYACPFNGFTPEVAAVSKGHYATVRGDVGDDNRLPFSGRVYHACGWVRAVRALRERWWSIGIWHDVSPGFDEQANHILRIPGIDVKTVREMTE